MQHIQIRGTPYQELLVCTTMRFPIVLLVCICTPTQAIALCDEDFGEPWQPSWATESRNDLLCSSSCTQDNTEDYEECCVCRSCAVWEKKEIELFIEFVSVLGRSIVVSDQAPSNTEVYKVEQKDSEMTEIPSNICNWDNETKLKERYPDDFTIMEDFMGNIVKLNFENNKIRKLPDLNCLVRLDELNLENNQLTYISNTSFTNLENLRSIDFSGNFIQVIDPHILTSEHLQSLFHVDFSRNEMTKTDVSNMVSLYPFCHINFKANQITELVNEANFTFNLSLTYGPGFVTFKDNRFTTWPDFEKLLNLTDITQLGHLFGFGFDFTNIPLNCDCNIEEFMSRAYKIVNAIWRDYMNITCTEPEKLAGQPVVKIPLERLICHTEDGCDPRCTCKDQPYRDTLFINCSKSNLKTLPDIPYSRYSHYVSLDVSNNQISRIGNASYLSRISMLDISGNNLVEIDNNVANLLENATYVDISNNPKLRQLPQMFQYHNICSRNMKNLQISCDCQSVWIEKWVHSKPCETHDNLFQCEIPQLGIKQAFEFAKDDLDCSPDGFPFLLETLIAAAIVVLILIGTLIYNFRYELLILCLRMRQISRNTVLPLNRYDVFLSFNDADDDVTKWVNYKLEPALIEAGYRVFQPSRDVAFGTERDSEIIKVLSKTRNFLVVMSESYLNQVDEGMRSWTENEWKYGWNNFKADRSKNIVLVNFDHVSSFDVIHPQIKAFLRVGCTVDFKNHDRNIMQEIFEKLGKPLGKAGKAFENKKLKFSQFELFTTGNADDKLSTPEKKEEYLAEIDNEQEDVRILTAFQQKKKKPKHISNPISHSEKDLANRKNNKDLKGQGQKCKYRKCYACCHGDNEMQTTSNNKLAKSTSRIKHLKLPNGPNETSSKDIIKDRNDEEKSSALDQQMLPTERLSNRPTDDKCSGDTARKYLILQKTTTDTNFHDEVYEKGKEENPYVFQGKASEKENLKIQFIQEKTIEDDTMECQNLFEELTDTDNLKICVDPNVLEIRNCGSLKHFTDTDESAATQRMSDTETVSIASSRTSFSCDINSMSDIYV